MLDRRTHEISRLHRVVVFQQADGKCQNEVQIKFKLLPQPDPLRHLRLKFVHSSLITRISMNNEDSGAYGVIPEGAW